MLSDCVEFEDIFCPKCKSEKFSYTGFDNTGVSAIYEVFKKLQVIEEKVDSLLEENGFEVTNPEVN